MSLNNGTKDLVIEYLVQIANALDGSTEDANTKTGDRLRDALSRIATYFGSNSLETSKELPAVTSANNGKVLKVVNGAWALADDSNTIELPAVTADNEGQVLKVDSEGHWVVGTIE